MEILQLLTLIAHIAVAGLMLGAVFFTLVFITKTKLTSADAKTARLIHKYGRPLAAIQLVLGVALIGFEPEEFANNYYIWSKVGLYVAAGLLAAFIVDTKLKQLINDPTDPKLARTTKIGVWLLLLIIIAIIAVGVLAAQD